MGKASEAKMPKNRLERGSISLLLLFIIFFLSSAGFLSFYKANSQSKMVRHEAQKIKARYLADSGLEWALASLNNDPNWAGGTLVLEEGTIEIKVQKSGSEYRIISTAQLMGSSQTSYGDYRFNGTEFILICYGEQYHEN